MFENLWILSYRHGSNPNCQKIFSFEGSLKEATARAHSYCNTMGFMHPYVKPFLSDLDSEQNSKLRQWGQPLESSTAGN